MPSPMGGDLGEARRGGGEGWKDGEVGEGEARSEEVEVEVSLMREMLKEEFGSSSDSEGWRTRTGVVVSAVAGVPLRGGQLRGRRVVVGGRSSRVLAREEDGEIGR